jgi:acyl carrier protein
MAMERSAVLQVIRKNLSEVVGDDALTAFREEAPLKELGADSLQTVEVFSLCMRDLKARVPRAELSRVTSVGMLADSLMKGSSV